MMQKQAPKIIIIAGPTSSGKSGVALELAKKFDSEIISADSRQVYRKMDIGTGKVEGAWSLEHEAFVSEGIPHYLIDVAQPMEDFNISHFKTLANKAVEEILAKGKTPIICGGTAFWIDAIVKNTDIPEVAPNVELRAILEKQTLEELFMQLKKIDPERAANIDSKNKVRLVRALEICEKLGTVPKLQTIRCHSGLPPRVDERTSSRVEAGDPESSQSHLIVNNLDSHFHGNDNNKYDFLQIGIKTEREVLNAKIKKRLDERFEQGMIKEVEDLHKNNVSWEWMERIGLEYRWIARFLQNQISESEMREKLYFDIIHYAKRQMTWLKRNKNIIWLENYQDIEKEVENFLQKK